MQDSANLPVVAPIVVDGEVDDGITDDDRARAEIGRRMRASGQNPNAVSDPAQVAAIRRRMEFHRLPWRQRVLRRGPR